MARMFPFAIFFTLLLPNATDANDDEKCDYPDICGKIKPPASSSKRGMKNWDEPDGAGYSFDPGAKEYMDKKITERQMRCKMLTNESSASAREEFGMGCQEIKDYCCTCAVDGPVDESDGKPKHLMTINSCPVQQCPKGYMFEYDVMVDEAVLAYFKMGVEESITCEGLWHKIKTELGCFSPCEYLYGVQLGILDACCTPKDVKSVRLVLFTFLLTASCFLGVMVLTYLFILLSEPRTKMYQEAKKRFISMKSLRSNTSTSSSENGSFFLTPSSTDDLPNNHMSFATRGTSLMVQVADSFMNKRRTCMIACSWLLSCLSCTVLAPAFGVLFGFTFIRDVVGLKDEIAIVSGIFIVTGLIVCLLVFKVLREVQIRWYRTWTERRRRDWTCKQRSMFYVEAAVQIVFLLLAGLCMHGYGPVSCMSCIRTLQDQVVWDTIGAPVQQYCARFQYHSREYDRHRAFAIIFLVLGPVDMCVRVAIQCGKLWKLESWRYFFSAKLHRGEALTLMAAAIAVVYDVSLLKKDYQPKYCRRLAVANVLIFLNRAFRITMYLANVNLAQIKKDEVDFENRRVWPYQYQEEKAKYSRRNIVRFEDFLDMKSVQFGFFILQAWFGALYCISYDHVIPLKDEKMGSTVLTTKPLIRLNCSLLCFILLMELAVRCGAQGAELFFRTATHIFEVILLGWIMLCFLYAWYFLGSGPPWDGLITIMCFILVVIHRIIRIIGIHYNVSASGFDAQNVFDAKAIKMFEAYCGDILDVAPQNVHIVVDEDIDIFVSKATLKAGAFDGIHLPIVPEVALVEELHINVRDQGRLLTGNILEMFSAQTESEPNSLTIKNLLILCGPGDGLSSADRCAESPDSNDYWNHENVKEAKAQLVDMISRRIRSKKPDKVKSQKPHRFWSPAGLKQSIKKAQKAVKDDLTNAAKRDAFRHFTVDIKNVVLQFEDGQDQLGIGNALISAKLGSLWVERKRGVLVNSEIFRASIRIEFKGESLEQSVSASFMTNRKRVPTPRETEDWREHRAALDPAAIVKRMVGTNASERLRWWASDLIMEPDKTCPLYNHQRLHSWSEDSPERCCVITVLKASMSGMPKEEDSPTKPEDTRPSLLASTTAGSAIGYCYHQLSRMTTSPTETTTQSHDTAASRARASAASSQRSWNWQVVTKPLRFKVDDAQLRVVRRISGAVQSWELRDNSLRWRPDVLPSEASQGTERRTVIWFWWLYAYHGVLASLGRRSNRLGLDLLWRVQLCRRYTALLTSVAQRCKQGPILRLDKIEKPVEQGELYDLQFKLTLKDIMRCRREVLKSFLSAQEELVIDVEERGEPARLATPDSQSTSQTTNGSSPSIASKADETPAKLDGVSDMFLRMRGEWSIEIPVLELRLCRWNLGPRPVIIHCRSNQVFLDLSFEPILNKPTGSGGSWKDKLARLSPHFAVTFSVDSFSVTCPQAETLVPGDRCHIWNVTKPTLFRTPTYPEFRPGMRADQNVFLGWRASWIAEVDNPIPIKMEFFAGDMRCMYPVPLVLAFKQFRQSSYPSWDVEVGANNAYALSPEEHALVSVQNVHQDMLYRQRYEQLRRKKGYTWFKRLVGIPGKSNDFHVDLHLGSIRGQRIRYVVGYGNARHSMAYVEDYNFRPYCGSFRRGTSDHIKSRLMTLEAFFGDTTSRECWSQDFTLPVWESLIPEDQQSIREQRFGPADFLPSSVEWGKRIIFTKHIQQGRLEREYARWRTGVSGHHIFPSGNVGQEPKPGDKLFSTAYFDFEDRNRKEVQKTWSSMISSSTSKVFTNKWSRGECCPSQVELH